jgi:hypothetical protein
MKHQCEGTIQSGYDKGYRCPNSAQSNGYCGNHQRQAERSYGSEDGSESGDRSDSSGCSPEGEALFSSFKDLNIDHQHDGDQNTRLQAIFSPLYERDVEYEARPACLKSTASFVTLEELQKECDRLGFSEFFCSACRIVSDLKAQISSRGLNIEQAAALCMYTMEAPKGRQSVYRVLNDALRAYRPQDRDIPHLRCLLTLVQSSVYGHDHSAEVTIFRTMSVKLRQDMYNRIVDTNECFRIWFPTFSSCSLKKFAAEEFIKEGQHNVMFRILSWKNGARIKWISLSAHEEEVLLPAYTLFEIVGHRVQEGYLEVDLEWVDL